MQPWLFCCYSVCKGKRGRNKWGKKRSKESGKKRDAGRGDAEKQVSQARVLVRKKGRSSGGRNGGSTKK